MTASTIVIRDFGITEYVAIWQAMKEYSAIRNSDSADEIWLTQHKAVYTLGLNRKNVRLPKSNQNNHNEIPVVLTDRGGKITFHGIGQIIVYLLLDLKRRQLTIRQLVMIIESSIIQLLANQGIAAVTKKNAPGVYVDDHKIASLGLRLKNNVCYHGLSLNVNMDLTPFKAIDPCGYEGLQMTQTIALGIQKTPEELGQMLVSTLAEKLNIVETAQWIK